ncbi:TetR/AcrR family transcriptional regulator [Actinomadura madurae]|uniref:TetR/AcrR family transcriptional regulator n=1 Tax=Actinomadura madurae TaxID=1993 RepID=UPI0020D25187|nr:TetR/AcrR family transcriptional regulator [Actinomadura madurae]MCQ0012999.1 TetR/AcrR family transcriptional regulator [Actinomadura madurae]
MGEHHLPGAGTEPEPGLRERKKRQTRRRISDIATGLFMTRGFDAVTIADVARAADVSVNTVFNYFKTKEDLFFDRQDEMIEAAGRDFRDRRPGESAAAVFRRRFFEGLDARSYQTAFHEGSEVWTRTVRDSPALTARSREMIRRAEDHLAGLLAEDTGAAPATSPPRRRRDDPRRADLPRRADRRPQERGGDPGGDARGRLRRRRARLRPAGARPRRLRRRAPAHGTGKATAGRPPPENECRTAPGRSYTP